MKQFKIEGFRPFLLISAHEVFMMYGSENKLSV
jgi:hypothetical protein